MSFKAKTDPFGIADTSTVVIVGEQDGKKINEVTAVGQDGSIVASETYGETVSPSCDYQIKADMTWAANAKKLGKVSTFQTNNKVALTKIEITTAAGKAPSISASGESVQSDATDGCLYSIPATALSSNIHAQILWSCCTISGTGCHLTAAKYSAEAKLVKAEKDGTCLAFDVGEGKLTASLTIKQCGDVAPTITITQDSGWKITGALACSNPDADYPTHTVTLTKYLAKDVANANNG